MLMAPPCQWRKSQQSIREFAGVGLQTEPEHGSETGPGMVLGRFGGCLLGLNHVFQDLFQGHRVTAYAV